MPESPSDVLHLLILVGGGILLLRKVAQIDGHHTLRVVILTTIFSLPVTLFFLNYGLTLGNPHSFSCMPEPSTPEFCLTE